MSRAMSTDSFGSAEKCGAIRRVTVETDPWKTDIRTTRRTTNRRTTMDGQPLGINRGRTTLTIVAERLLGSASFNSYEMAPWSRPRQWVYFGMNTNLYKAFISSVILFNMLVLVWETDSESLTGRTEHWMDVIGYHFFGVYSLDCGLKIFAYRLTFFKSPMNVFDLLIVLLDVINLTITVYMRDMPSMRDLPSMSLLKTARMFRLVKVLNSILIFRELYLMMQGFLSALRAIAFGTALIGVALTMWSILAVMFLDKRVKGLADAGLFDGCDRCPDAFSTVLSANYTFWQTIVAGDSWGILALPLLENYPHTGLIIFPVFIVVQLGLVNVIAAVMVDRQAQARVEDEALLYHERNEETRKSHERLQALFNMMDIDGGGSLSLREMIDAYDRFNEFKEILDMMDIKRADLPLVFDILDVDGSGDVSWKEFVQKLHFIRNVNSHTLLVFTNARVENALAAINKTCAKVEGLRKGMQDSLGIMQECDSDKRDNQACSSWEKSMARGGTCSVEEDRTARTSLCSDVQQAEPVPEGASKLPNNGVEGLPLLASLKKVLAIEKTGDSDLRSHGSSEPLDELLKQLGRQDEALTYLRRSQAELLKQVASLSLSATALKAELMGILQQTVASTEAKGGLIARRDLKLKHRSSAAPSMPKGADSAGRPAFPDDDLSSMDSISATDLFENGNGCKVGGADMAPKKPHKTLPQIVGPPNGQQTDAVNH